MKCLRSKPRDRLLGLCRLLVSVPLATMAASQDHPNTPTPVLTVPDRVLQGPLSWSSVGVASSQPRQAFPLRLLWKRQIPRDIVYSFRQAERSTPQIVDDLIWLGSSRTPGLLAFEPRAGWLVRRISTRGQVESPFIVEPDTQDLIMGDSQGYVSRHRRDGTLVWEHASPGPVLSSPGLGEGKVFFHAIDGTLAALDLDSGAPLWSYRRDPNLNEALALFGASVPVVSQGLVLTGFEDGSVVALRASDGSLAWEYQLSRDNSWRDVDGYPLLLDSDRLVISAYGGATVCLRVSTGEELWRAPHGSTSGALIHDGILYLPDADGVVVALSADTGARIWKWEIPSSSVPHQPIWWRNSLMVPTADGRLRVLDPATGTVQWELPLQELLLGFSTTICVGDGVVYAVSDGGWLYALGAKDYDMPAVPSRRHPGQPQM